MTTEELIQNIQSSGLFEEAEIKQWGERIQKEGVSESLASELASDIQSRIEVLLDVMGITSEESDAYKQLMLGLYAELKSIAKEYQKEEKQIENEATDFMKEASIEEVKKHVEELRATLASIAKS